MENNLDSKKTIAVVVTYNRKELLKECIQALKSQEGEHCDVLVIDNNSTDGTFEYIQEFVDGKNVLYVNTGENLGGAGGFNYGIKKAYQLGYEYIWIMDDDCIVHKDSLKEFLNADKSLNGNYGFLSSKVLWSDGEICKMNIQRKTVFRPVTKFEKDIEEIAMASFVSLFVKAEIIKELGLPIKEFFIWTDDWEFTRRISLKHKSYLVNKSVVTHKSKNNLGANIVKDEIDRMNRYDYIYRNDVYLYRREGIKGWIYIYLRNLYNYINILTSKTQDKKKRIETIRKATKVGKTFNPEIEKV